jgi:hypothetical protein
MATQKVIEVVQSDKLYRLDFILKDANDAAIDLTNGTPVLKVQRQTGTALKFSGDMTAGTPTAGQCYYTVQAADFDAAGDHHAEIEITYTDGKVITLTDVVIRVKPQLPRTI